ncbi:hypothetical protein CPJCM30710_23650 [Clostridium polyendosporum]|uniref:NusG domain-containing protein n=1 Tax=Clostridium polyendosporum TaxID=69208 RepID=A0A919VEZ3_9CLOT|nr:NusG domain II-containing protein [Clostridium polyendosporum]GIM29699.1 hypothetical protein CPJCM30710_23650 [Clostridium polyendosporum]
MTKNDKVLLIIIITITVLSFLVLYFLKLGRDEDKVAIIKVKGKVVQEIQLSRIKEDTTLSVDGLIGKAMIEVNKDGVRIIDAPCKDKICIHMNWAKHHSDSIICIPNQVVIEINEKKENFDVVTE